jgi:hypothetical protein
MGEVTDTLSAVRGGVERQHRFVTGLRCSNLTECIGLCLGTGVCVLLRYSLCLLHCVKMKTQHEDEDKQNEDEDTA